MRIKALASLAIALATVVLDPTDANACLSATSSDTNLVIRDLHRAQGYLDESAYTLARSSLKGRALQSEDEDELEQAQWIYAMSYVRDEHASLSDLEVSAHTMRKIRVRRTLTDVKSQVDLGEALSRMPDDVAEARTLLEPLAKADLIGSDHAYARLMRIGSTLEIRSTAFVRCQTMAMDKSLCNDGFLAETDIPSKPGFEKTWVPRFLVGLGALAIAAAFGVIAVVLVRLRRRTRNIAAFST